MTIEHRRRVGIRARRRGFGLVEMAAATALFATMVTITLQVVGSVARERQAIARREAATRSAGNLMEQILARPWAAVSTETLDPIVAEANRSRADAAGKLRVEVVVNPAIDGRGQKRVVVEVLWPDRARVAESPVRLVAWTYERQGNQP